MGEQTSTTDRAARAYAAIMDIARAAATSGDVAVFGGYMLAVGVWVGAGGWVYETSSASSQSLAHGRRKFAQQVVDGRHPQIVRAMAEHYERSMPVDPEPQPHGDYPADAKAYDGKGGVIAEKRKLDGYYDADHLPRVLDVVQLAHGAIGVVESIRAEGVLVRANDVTDGILSVYDANALRSVPPVAFQVAGVPGAVDNGNVPRDYATSELSGRAIGRARRIAPATRLTLAAEKTNSRHEYGRAFVYAIASIIDTNRLVAARCENEQWHESAPSRRLQLCAHCDTRGGSMPAPVAEPDVSALVGQVRTAVEQLAAAAHGQVAVMEQAAAETDPATSDDSSELLGRIIRRAHYGALRKMLEVLDSYVETMLDNVEAGGGRRPDVQLLHPNDVRSMVTDAARELGTADPLPGHLSS